ncbi:FMN-binding protein [Solimonas soli]|uniref:FMN-binding protein n=1 Tax=Solimonas soli TaxID=413479 RepID=UPI000488E02C|nr:FMN-binding protein [Solimonas soli]
MRTSFYLLPIALLASGAVQATTYLTVDQAQAQMLPGATLTQDFRQLTPAQIAAIRKDSGQSPLNDQLKAWRASDGSWFIVDEVVGKHEFITFAVTIDGGGAVRRVEVLDYREAYGSQVREAAWLAQFVGKKRGAPLALGDDIKNISGATLSSKHISDGVRRLLSTYAIVLAPGATA